MRIRERHKAKLPPLRWPAGSAFTQGISALFLLLVCTLSACQAPPTAPVRSTDASPAPSLPGKQYVVDMNASEIRLLVYRDGPLAHIGHNHVVIGKVQGEIIAAEAAASCAFKLRIPVEDFEVDATAPRTEEGAEFATVISDAARAGTRNNMLGPNVLDSEHYPTILVESLSLSGPRWNPTISARITLRGKPSMLTFPAAVIEQGDMLTVIASFQIVQTSMGLEPFSVLGGALRVRDTLDVRIRLVAHPAR